MRFWLRPRYCCNNVGGSCQVALADRLFSAGRYRRLDGICPTARDGCGQPLVPGKPRDMRLRWTIMTVLAAGLIAAGKLIYFPAPLEHVQFATERSETPDDVGTLSIEIVRDGEIDRAVTVDYATIDGSAKAGEDYDAERGRLSFAAGEARRSVAVTLQRDTSYRRERRQFSLMLRNVRGEPHHTVAIVPPVTSRTDAERIEESVRNASNKALDVATQVVHKRVLDGLIAGSVADSAEAGIYRESLAVTNENLTRSREAYLRLVGELRTQQPGAVLSAMDRVAGVLKTRNFDQQADAAVVMKRQFTELLDGGSPDMDRWAQELSTVVPPPPNGRETRI